ncbi:hypothetical protein ACWPKO_22560 (plasmid) [Coraliomargarita sp. W4R53]
MDNLPYWLWWTEDPAASEWFRTFVAALFGVLAGGLFTMWGQSKAERAQLIRDYASREAQIEDARRQALADDMRRLHKLFAELLVETDHQPNTLGEMLGSVPWRNEWKRIWNAQVRSQARIEIDLIPDPDIRAHVIEMIGFLDDARDHSREGFWPGSPSRALRWLSNQLVSEVVETLAAYLRREAHATRRSDLLRCLHDERAERNEWENHEIERSDEQAAEWYLNASPEEIQQVDDVADALRLERWSGVRSSTDTSESSPKQPKKSE